jgi:hypothetical protein
MGSVTFKTKIFPPKETVKISKHLRESVICTAVFAVIFATITACGGNIKTIITPIVSTVQHASAKLSGFVHAGGAIGANRNNGPQIAAMFATSATPSVLPESGQAGCTDLSQNFTKLRYAVMTTENGNPCGDANSGVLTRDDPTATDYPDGPAVNFDGTLSAVVVTAQVDGIGEVRCTNVTDTASLQDGQHFQPWYDTATNTVIFTAEHVVLPVSCVLPNVQPGAVIHRVVIKFAKQ